MMITDFSSVKQDCIITKRPIIVAPFGKEKYIKNDREFQFNYDEVRGGTKVKDWDEVLLYIEKFINNQKLYENTKFKGI